MPNHTQVYAFQSSSTRSLPQTQFQSLSCLLTNSHTERSEKITGGEGGRRERPDEEAARGNGIQLRESTESRARFKIQGVQRWLLRFLPRGRLDDLAAAACISQRLAFWMGFGWEKKLRAQPRLGQPGRGWQGYSLGVLVGMDPNTQKPDILSKLCSFCVLRCFSL